MNVKTGYYIAYDDIDNVRFYRVDNTGGSKEMIKFDVPEEDREEFEELAQTGVKCKFYRYKKTGEISHFTFEPKEEIYDITFDDKMPKYVEEELDELLDNIDELDDINFDDQDLHLS